MPQTAHATEPLHQPERPDRRDPPKVDFAQDLSRLSRLTQSDYVA